MNLLKNKIFISVFLFFVFFAIAPKADAATLFIKPSQTEVSVGNIVNVQISVDTAGKIINNAESIIQFPKDLLEIVSLENRSSILSFWIEEPSFSNSIGQATFNGGVPNPGFQGSSGKIISITFRAKRAGTASVIFLNSAVRENDGLGTDILSGTGQANISIVAAKTIPTPAPATIPTESTLGITSSTHPDKDKWYADSTPEFAWELPDGALEVRTLIGRSPTSNPSVSYIPPISKKKVDELPDGVHYFSLQVYTSAGWSGISRYRVNIDTTPPKPFSIAFPHGNKGWEPQPVVFFNTADNESGISHYEIKIGRDTSPIKAAPLAVSNPYVLPPQVPGTYTLLVSAIDNAGNIRNSSEEFTIEGIDTPIITFYPEAMEEGEILKIRGTTYPDSDVTIFVREGENIISEEYTRSNSSGDFAFAVTEQLNSGVYTFTVQVKDGRGAQSIETSPLSVSVRSEFIADLVSFVLKYLSAAILILLALGALTWGGTHLWFKIPRTIQRMRREAREAEKVSEKAFKVLREGVENHVARLKKAKRKLTAEEAEFLEQFSEKLEETEKVITKEIQDVSRS